MTRFITVVVLLALSAGAQAQDRTQGVCRVAKDDVPSYYTDYFQSSLGDNSEQLDEYDFHPIMGGIRLDMNQDVPIQAVGEGFLRTGKSRFMVVPRVISLYFNEKDVMYFCANWGDSVEERWIEIAFLKPSKTNFFKKKKKQKYVPKLLKWDPLTIMTDATELVNRGLEPIPVLGDLFMAIDQSLLMLVKNIARETVDFVFDAGAYRVRIEPGKIKLWGKTKIFKFISTKFTLDSFEMDTPWMTQDLVDPDAELQVEDNPEGRLL